MNNIPADWPKARTANGVLVVPGLKVRDYNWDDTEVSSETPSMYEQDWEDGEPVPGTGTAWFYTTNGGMFDGDRLWALDK